LPDRLLAFRGNGIGMIHDEIVDVLFQLKNDARKAGLRMGVTGTGDKLDDLCAHDALSQTAMTTSPIKASRIRQAVIGVLLELKCAA
jgi:hypothetical protein